MIARKTHLSKISKVLIATTLTVFFVLFLMLTTTEANAAGSFYDEILAASKASLDEVDDIVSQSANQSAIETLEVAQKKTLAVNIYKLYKKISQPTDADIARCDRLLDPFAVPLTASMINTKAPLASGFYRLEGNVSPTKTTRISSGSTVIIDLNGYVFNGSSIKDTEYNNTIINNQGHLIIKDSRPNAGPYYFQKSTTTCWSYKGTTPNDNYAVVYGGIVTGGNDTTDGSAGSSGGGAVKMGMTSTTMSLSIYGGSFVGNKSTRAGGAFYGGDVYMYGGQVIGNYATRFGAGISVSGGFNMYNGYIGENNTSKNSSYNKAVESSNYRNAQVVIGKTSYFLIHGGTIDGNVTTVTNLNSSNPPYFIINGGTINGSFTLLNSSEATFTGGKLNGSLYMYKDGKCTVEEGGLIVNGGKSLDNTIDVGGVYIAQGQFIMTGGEIRDCNATQYGGGIYVNGGSATVSGGVIKNCSSTENGGAIYVQSGSFSMSGGTIENCTSSKNGGAVFVSGGNAKISGGTIQDCSAGQNGGGITVEGGSITMSGGEILRNVASNGAGGAMYVNSSSTNATVIITSGSIMNNRSTANGGAIAVVGSGSETLTVTIGIPELHREGECDHTDDGMPDLDCPIVKNNAARNEGGAIYISGSVRTNLNIYCIEESGNRGGGNEPESEETTLSDFLKVDGGTVIISSAKDNEVSSDGDANLHGKSVISSSIHVEGGKVSLYGNMSNPLIKSPITVDITEETGEYYDKRVNLAGETAYYKINYFENFEINGKKTGVYTAYQIQEGETHIIKDIIYVHSGYTIAGWHTDKDATDISDSDPRYYPVLKPVVFTDPENTITGFDTETDTLILYAIWNNNTYTVIFDSNVGEGTTVTGIMENQTMLCTEPSKLNPNTFARLGYLFQGWGISASQTVPNYVDNEEIEPITTTQGAEVKLYAIWLKCDHSDASAYIYSQSSGDSVKCTCACNQYVTVIIVADSAVYDGFDHGASVEYFPGTEGGFGSAHIAANSIVSSIKHEKDSVEINTLPRNAGSYRAYVTVGSKTAEIIYVIEKAEQSAPGSIVYAIDDLTSIMTVSPIAASEQTGNAAHLQIAYLSSTGWQRGYLEGSVWQQNKWKTSLDFALNASWTSYFVQAYYPGDENYKDSVIVVSEARFFTGDVEVKIKPGAGTSFSLVTDDGNLTKIIIYVTDSKRYIHSDLDFVLEETYKAGAPTTNKVSFAEEIASRDFEQVTYILSDVTTDHKTITIVFDDARWLATVDAAVAPNQQFGNVDNTETAISKDSAFTAAFTLTNFFGYTDLALNFDEALPVGTSVIMVDKSSSAISYWYKIITASTDSIAIEDFGPMGGGANFVVDESGNAPIKLQFVVDFSRAEEHGINALSASLTAQTATAPALPASNLDVTLTAVSHVFASGQSSGSINVSYAQSQGEASKWDWLEAAIVITPINQTILPEDASLKVIETLLDGSVQSTHYRQNELRQLIIPISKDTIHVELVLDSELSRGGVYQVKAELYASRTGTSPANGIKLGSIESLELVIERKLTPSASIVGEEQFYKQGETLRVSVEVSSEGYPYDVILLKKGENGFIDTGWKYQKQETDRFDIELELSILEPSVYCITVVVRNEQNAEILNSPYYFVIEE